MANVYARALALPGAWQFSGSAFIARLPLSMAGLGTVLLISTLSGSYAEAGTVVASYGVVGALGSIVSARLADRWGQNRLLPILAVLDTAALLTVVALELHHAPLIATMAAAAVAGFTAPPIGSFVRARWVHVTNDPATLRSGFALESIVDEVIFTVGPLLTAWLAFTFALPLPLYVACGLTLVGSLLLALQRGSQPVVHHEARTRRRSALALPGVALVVLASLGMGALFGADEVTTVAFARIAGADTATGIVLGLFAVGSMLGGLFFGARHWHAPLARQGALLLTALLIGIAILPWMRSVLTLTIATFVAGLLVAPCLIVLFSFAERLVPAAQLTEGLTWTSSALGIGFAIGSVCGGALVDSHGTTAGFWLCTGSVAWSLLWIVAGQRTLLAHAAPGPAPLAPISLVQEPIPGPAPGAFEDEGGPSR